MSERTNTELPFMMMQVAPYPRGPAKGQEWELKSILPTGYLIRDSGGWPLPPWKRCNFLTGLPIFPNLHEGTICTSWRNEWSLDERDCEVHTLLRSLSKHCSGNGITQWRRIESGVWELWCFLPMHILFFFCELKIFLELVLRHLIVTFFFIAL